MKILPLHDNVLVELIPIGPTNESGVILSNDQAQEQYYKGLVLALGPDCPLTQIAVNSVVLIKAYAGIFLVDHNKEYKIIEAKDIMAVIIEE